MQAGATSANGFVPDATRRDESCGIAVMAKASAPGRTKTRLTPPLTADEAARFNTAFLQDIAANLRAAARQAAARHAAIAGYMAYGPPGPESLSFFRKSLPPDIGLFEMWRGDFGVCLYETIVALLDHGHTSAVVLNSDSPTLPTALLVETATRLAAPGDRAVLGPSTDGGYYLLGLKAAHRHMFADIAWSTERVAEQTITRAREIGLALHILPAWYDVDDVDALRRLHAEVNDAERTEPAPAHGLVPHRARHSAALLTDLCRRGDFMHRLNLPELAAAPAGRPALAATEVAAWK
ncbi:MAG: TIGR04282 family arsenosugar biosynthesis glycosyltransferase [Rhodoplanes sp.]|uniref:TIGR04282 family arsenosugar biosynthesis glycosyltransferase n=1 Tax=Rhodoplanes sp. TaxID=1968906 RepID=UPI0017D971E9|nr:TIGR04282 family arsenosugar biosynthesis glycosyltransferase [Rhodoplanes sp.]NVO17031.1 TIGR04282 family arsenosugar biosynthesis glycosyltransferase [Rhodoplanes sp.]